MCIDDYRYNNNFENIWFSDKVFFNYIVFICDEIIIFAFI